MTLFYNVFVRLNTLADEIFQEIRKLITDHQFSSFVLCGDMNCDFSRKTGHVYAVQSFVDEYSLIKAWDDFTVDFTHSQEVQDNLVTATIDHFFWNESLSSQIIDAGVVHSIDNSSDHSPVYCVIKVSHNQVTDTPAVAGACRPNWKAASTEEKGVFKQALGDKLSELKIPDSVVSCREVHCKHLEHQHALDDYMTNILNMIEVEAKESLPVIKPCITPMTIMQI